MSEAVRRAARINLGPARRARGEQQKSEAEAARAWCRRLHHKGLGEAAIAHAMARAPRWVHETLLEAGLIAPRTRARPAAPTFAPPPPGVADEEEVAGAQLRHACALHLEDLHAAYPGRARC